MSQSAGTLHIAGEQGSGVTLANWLPVTATILAALIAAGVAVYQSRRTAAAQRQLEQEKLRGVERAAELAQERAERSQERDRLNTYRREQVLPFLDALDKTLNASYVAAYVPEHFPDLGGRVPQVRQHADQVLGEWLTLYREMSQHRMRLFLALDQEDLETVVSDLVALQEQTEAVLATRHRLWFHQASEGDLWEAHRKYIAIGYRVLMGVRAYVTRPFGSSFPHGLDEDARRELSHRLAIPLEKLSAVTLPYGSYKDFTWLALWDLDTRPEWLSVVDSMNQGTHAEFEAALQQLAVLLHQDKNCIETQLMRLGSGNNNQQVFCLTAKLASRSDLDQFMNAGLPACRKTFPILWSSLRQPVEFKMSPKEDSAVG
jgi:hypothetical protein